MPKDAAANSKPALNSVRRRRLLLGLGALGTTGLAGCTGSSSDGGSGDGSDGGSGDSEGGSSGSDGSSSQSVKKLQMSGWDTNETAELVREFLAEFNEANPKYEVSYTPVSENYEQKLKTQLGAGEAPDVFYADAKYSPSWADSGVLLDMSDDVENDADFDTDDFFQPLLDAFRHNGTLYGIPKDFGTLQMFHNKKLFEQAGIDGAPETWSELRSTLETLKAETDVKYPMAFVGTGDPARLWWALLTQTEGQVLSDDGSECVCASDAAVEALEFMEDLRKDELAGLPSEMGVDWMGPALADEKAAIVTSGHWCLSFLQAQLPDTESNFEVSHLPVKDGGQKGTVAFTVCYTAAKNTEYPEASADVIKSLTSKETMKQWAQKGWLPARKSLLDLDYYDENPRRKTMLAAAEWSKPFQYGVHSDAIRNRLNPQLEAVLTGAKSARDALETAQEKINSEVLSG